MGKLVRLAPPARWALAGSVGVGLLSTAAVVVQALALASLLSGAMAGAAPGDRPAALAWLAAGVAVRGLCALAAEALARVGAVWTQAELRSRLLATLLRQVPADDRSAGQVATVAGRGVESLDVYVGRCLPDFVLAVAAPLALVATIGVLDWVSGLVVVVALALFPVFAALVGRASRQLAGRRWEQLEALGRHVLDVFEGMAVLKALGRSCSQRARIAQAGDALRRASMGTLRVAFLSALVLDELASVSVALVAVPLGLRLLHGGVALAPALAVLIVAPEVFVPLRRASAEFHQSTEGLAALDSVLRVVGGDPAPERAAHGSDAAPQVPVPDPSAVGVSLRRVTLRRPGRQASLLDELDLSIGPGETVAMVGENGAGKSTVLAALLGFVEPSSGAVTVGGHDLWTLDLDAWRRNVTYLPEHPTILAGTLAENLRLADRSAGDERLVGALQAAGASHLLDQLDDGLATLLGEGGRPVSAGERQRIALARVFLRPTSLYLLDEPTVHLDAATEEFVLHGLREVLEGASALVVTHRPAALSVADRVVTLCQGRISSVDGGAVVAGLAVRGMEELEVPA